MVLRQGHAARGGTWAALVIGLGLAGGAAAQQPARGGAAPQPAPSPSAPPMTADAAGPDRTSAVFGDWTLHCLPRPAAGAAAPSGRICEMVQTAQDQRGQTITAIGLARAARAEPLKLVALVPVNVQPSQPVRLVLEAQGAPAAGRGAEPPSVAMPYQNCLPRGCAAEVEMRDEAMLRRLRGRGPDQQGRLEWRGADGQARSVPVSFRGFAAALEALERETSGG